MCSSSSYVLFRCHRQLRSCISVCANLTIDLVLITDAEEKQLPDVIKGRTGEKQKELIQHVDGSTEWSDMMTGVAPGCDRVLQRRWCCKFQGREQSAGTWVFHVVWHILMKTQTLSTFGARLTEWAGSEIGRWFSARQFLRSLLSRQGLGKDKHKHFFKLMQPAQTSKIFSRSQTTYTAAQRCMLNKRFGETRFDNTKSRHNIIHIRRNFRPCRG